MKNKFKIILCVLLIALISVIAFAGVYTKDEISYKSVLPEYKLDSELEGKRVTYYKLDDEVKEVIHDKDGNEVSEIPEGANEEDYTRESVKTNPDDILTEENYMLAKKVFERRLKEIGLDYYSVRADKQTGEIVVEIAENNNTNTYLQYLPLEGGFSISDSEDGTVLIDEKDVTKAAVGYNTISAEQIKVFLDIKLNKEGAKKLEEMSRKYIKIEEEEKSDTNTIASENTVVEEATTEEEHNHEEEQKTVVMKIGSSKSQPTYFAEVMKNGELTIELGDATSETKVLEIAKQGGVLAMLVNSGNQPLKYTITDSEYIESKLKTNALTAIIISFVVVVAIIIAYLIFKYKIDGLFAGLSFVASIGILLLIIRYTNTIISIGGFLSMIVLAVLETYFIITILNSIKKDPSVDNTMSITKSVYKKRLDIIIVLMIVAVVFTFMKEVKIYSIGMTLFYGIISLALTNLTFLRTLLIENHKAMK